MKNTPMERGGNAITNRNDHLQVNRTVLGLEGRSQLAVPSSRADSPFRVAQAAPYTSGTLIVQGVSPTAAHAMGAEAYELHGAAMGTHRTFRQQNAQYTRTLGSQPGDRLGLWLVSV
ncbi:uncharacterized protein CANTADRAFT_268045 [Suhomyces tanzawaensis NRRL Y-17324]|uniref:Uncharacterized protein n=1 Tax=Suhomyces tanzawaensis NRRL Y-17324 TaxID=984487 RepID=A0A1E4SG82_9ASCO|nr:uncharacterized protein CANTADRAFT_268045 [Suhomyces tanzawaensis NRRL Y-17324]ODV78517.1 hypothetical protein CANTADRAFT_268045 [Suhomyces tanzawaensis NRRL Y-17324]